MAERSAPGPGDRVRVNLPGTQYHGLIGIVSDTQLVYGVLQVAFDSTSPVYLKPEALEILPDRWEPFINFDHSAFFRYTPQETPMPEPRTPKTGEIWTNPAGRRYEFVSDEADIHGYRIARFSDPLGKVWAIVGPTELSVLTPPRPTVEEVLKSQLGREYRHTAAALAAHLREQFPELP